MPIIKSSFISNLQFINYLNNYILLENFEYNQVQKTEQQRYVQGSIGTHVMNIDGVIYECNMDALIFIFENSDPRGIYSPLNLIWDALKNYTDENPSFYLALSPYPNVIMTEGTINIQKESINSSIKLIGDSNFVSTNNVFSVIENQHDALDSSIIRIAKNYDTILQIGSTNIGILSGSIKFTIDTEISWFIGATDPIPFFSTKGFNISGDVKIGYNPYESGGVIAPQYSNNFTINDESIKLYVGNFWLKFNNAKLIFSNIKKSIKAGEIITADISFESYSPIVSVGTR